MIQILASHNKKIEIKIFCYCFSIAVIHPLVS